MVGVVAVLIVIAQDSEQGKKSKELGTLLLQLSEAPSASQRLEGLFTTDTTPDALHSAAIARPYVHANLVLIQLSPAGEKEGFKGRVSSRRYSGVSSLSQETHRTQTKCTYLVHTRRAQSRQANLFTAATLIKSWPYQSHLDQLTSIGTE